MTADTADAVLTPPSPLPPQPTSLPHPARLRSAPQTARKKRHAWHRRARTPVNAHADFFLDCLNITLKCDKGRLRLR